MEEESEQTKYKTKASTQKEKQVKDFDKKKEVTIQYCSFSCGIECITKFCPLTEL
jgi:hypothetical protein